MTLEKRKTLKNSCHLSVIFILFITGCNVQEYEFSEVKHHSISDFDLGFKEYCKLDLSQNFESNAVLGSFYGDYHNTLDQATKDASFTTNNSESIEIVSSIETEELIKAMKGTLNDPNASAETKAKAETFLEILTGKTPEEVFSKSRPVSALEHIVNTAKNFHFTLINEAHYSSQNRAFTKELLQPLWEEGYRYLALETLGYTDPTLIERGYPTLSTGYYTKDSNFGNMVREAIKIGYQVIPYETQNPPDGTLRDRDQANNIFRQTFQKDKLGKVLIHAGYSHISEMGDKGYEPMGYQLKKIANQDILTVDQEKMTGLNDTNKLDHYYKEAINKFDLSVPTVFLNEEGEVIVDPLFRPGIDIQVYHPMTVFEKERPTWLKTNEIKRIPLPEEIRSHKGSLIRATYKGEVEDAVPVDQFIITDEKELHLPPGSFDLRIINCEGDLIATSNLVVK